MNGESTPLGTARRIALNFLSKGETANTYCNQLAYEALLRFGADIPAAGPRVEAVINASGIAPGRVLPWGEQQFHDLAYPYFESRGDLSAWQESHIATTDAWINEARRRPNGSIIHDCTNHPTIKKTDPVGSLIDMQQAYCIRLCRAAKFTGETRYVDECLLQYRAHRDELRSVSGCYHQGKGWLPDDGLSPEPWSRGQGWYLHGMANCLPLLESWPEAREEIRSHTRELLDALKPLQGPSGLWHQLVDVPEESRPDSSGSALILEAYVAYSDLYSTRIDDAVIQRAWAGLSVLVDDAGVVDKACKGPGTIWQTGPWRNSEAPKGDPHGVFSMLFACAALHRSKGRFMETVK